MSARVALVALAVGGLLTAACGGDSGTGASYGEDAVDVQTARAALIERDDLGRSFDETDGGDTDNPFADLPADCEALESLDDTPTTARETGTAYLSGDASRWVTSAVWMFETEADATAAVAALEAADTARCLAPYFKLRFIEITAERTSALDLLLDDTDATPIDIGDGGVRVVTHGRFQLPDSQGSVTFELTIVQRGRALAMLLTMDGATEPAKANAELLDLMLTQLERDATEDSS